MFDNRVRNQLKDFIGEKHWSVSRFAMRYVELYAELYSKMEAPGTSTARKLIEDKNHVFSEKEVTVLERLTGTPFIQLWLENQHKILVDKSSGYATTADNLDPQALLDWEIRRRSSALPTDNPEPLVAVLQRYVAADTLKPLVILTAAPQYALDIVRQTLINGEEILPDTLQKAGEDSPLNTLYCNAEQTPPNSYYGALLLRRAIEIMQSGTTLKRNKRVILIFEADKAEAATVRSEWASASYIYMFTPSAKLAQSAVPPEPEHNDYREFCLSRLRTLPPAFKDEIMACKPGVECEDIEECAGFIVRLYKEQRQWFKPDSYFYKPLHKLIASGSFPDDWLDDDFDRESFLTAVAEYPVWLRNKEQELTESGIRVEEDKIHQRCIEDMERGLWPFLMYIDTPSLDADGWHDYFEMEYTKSLMQ